jgi:uncharacterized protein YjbI with pentapeptide repeats
MTETFKTIITKSNRRLLIVQKSFSSEIIHEKDDIIDLSDSQIGLCEFNDFKFCNVVFYGTHVYESSFNNCTFQNCDLTRCVFQDCIFENCKIINCDLVVTEFSTNYILNSNFQDIKFRDTDFSGSTIINTTFKNNEYPYVYGKIFYGKTNENLKTIIATNLASFLKQIDLK